MNAERLRAVANLIELEDRFDYASWTIGVLDEDDLSHCYAIEPARHLDRCGTKGCVAGWAAHLALREDFESDADEIDDFAADYLGLTDEQAEVLFCGRPFWSEERSWTDVGAVEIAKFLRSLADGEAVL